MEEITLALAAAIVKTAFKFWTKDSDLANNITDELTDLIKDKVVGNIGQRKARRWVEDLEAIVNGRLLKYMAYEFSGLTENERDATILAVAATLSKAKITDKELWDQDLDPLQLEQFLKQTVPNADKDLGYQGQGLYARLLPEACAYVVSLAASLPNFQVGAFSELLRRDTAIIARLDEILKLLPPQLIQGQSAQSNEIDLYNAFTTAYRRQIVNRLDHLRLFGVDAFTQQYPLTLAYISLSVYSHRKSHQRSRHLESQANIKPDISIEAVLANTKRLFLSGQAGSGKTTILQWLAVRAARKDFPHDLASWNNYEPFFIPLRKYIDGELPTPAQFVDSIGKHISAQMPDDWVERRLVTGTALLLIDGIDELPPSKYESVKQWVINLTNDFPTCAFLVTSRPGAVSDNWLATANFSSATLAPMPSSAVRIFVKQWINALRSETIDREEREMLSEYEQPIARALLAGRHLRELASTPLLCALLCALYYTRNGELPSDRMGVYAAALDMLQRRDPERGIKPYGKIGREESRIVLQDIAYWLIRNGLSDADVSRVLNQMGISVQQLHKVTATPKEIYQQLLIRSGLLQEPAADRVSFIHRTFQEYLAANAAIAGDNVEELALNALDARWTQMFIMAVGLALPGMREQLLNSLLNKRPSLKPEDQATVALIALACLETSARVPKKMLQRIRKASSAIIPPQSMEHVNLIVKTGDLALDILTNVRVTSVHEACMVLETIRRIGAEEGLQLMGDIVRQQPLAVFTDYFANIWRTFNATDVANMILQIPGITALHIVLPQCEPVIPMLPNLDTVYCTATGALPNLGSFRALTCLRFLTIHSIGVVDLSPFTGRNNLTIRIVIRHRVKEKEEVPGSEELLARYVVGAGGLGRGSTVRAEIEGINESIIQ